MQCCRAFPADCVNCCWRTAEGRASEATVGRRSVCKHWPAPHTGRARASTPPGRAYRPLSCGPAPADPVGHSGASSCRHTKTTSPARGLGTRTVRPVVVTPRAFCTTFTDTTSLARHKPVGWSLVVGGPTGVGLSGSRRGPALPLRQTTAVQPALPRRGLSWRVMLALHARGRHDENTLYPVVGSRLRHGSLSHACWADHRTRPRIDAR